MFGVFDGHGTSGHHVSQFLKKTLPKNIQKIVNSQPHLSMDTMIKNAFNKTSLELIKSGVSCEFSGSTCVFCIVIGSIFI
jgi:serine/threonine protein phosphatase PrpC